MKSILKVVLAIFILLFVNGCASKCSIFSTDPACNALIIGGAVIASPILIPYAIINNSSESKVSKEGKEKDIKEYMVLKNGVEDDNITLIKECIKICDSNRYNPKFYNREYMNEVYDEELLKKASEKLLSHETSCITTEDYPIYLAAKLNLFYYKESQNQTQDVVALYKIYDIYASSKYISYDNDVKDECFIKKDEEVKNPLIERITNPKIIGKLNYLKATLFLKSLQDKSAKEIDEAFLNCPKLILHDEYDNEHNKFYICKLAYKKYMESPKHTADLKTFDEYYNIWNFK
ncbi:MAG: hypothetical protein ACK5LP_07610 [Campylobacteraceae bacterium]